VRLPLLIALSACKASIGADMDANPEGLTVVEDAPPIDAAIPLGPWGDLQALEFPGVGDDDPTSTADLLELYFNRSDDIYVVTRASLTSPWSTPAVVAELSSAAAESTPEVSYDGLTMYLASARAGTLGANDIFVSTRPSRAAVWGAPVHLPELSSPLGDGSATTPDGLTMVLDSLRSTTSLDLFITQRPAQTAAWPTPAALAMVNTSASAEGNPMLSTDKLTLYFDSNRTGDGEIYIATRANVNATFSLPVRIDELASPASSETDPWISQDGRTMLFTSNRDGTQRIWQATR
jgi:hypothetical protein